MYPSSEASSSEMEGSEPLSCSRSEQPAKPTKGVARGFRWDGEAQGVETVPEGDKRVGWRWQRRWGEGLRHRGSGVGRWGDHSPLYLLQLDSSKANLSKGLYMGL